MKSSVMLFVLLISLVIPSLSQTIQVSWDKTTVLIFDSPIQSVDRGNRFLLSELDSKALNMLKLKAGSKELPETNLHVLTEDGNIHAFEVIYSNNPTLTTLDFRKDPEGKKAISSYGFFATDFVELARHLENESAKAIKKKNSYGVHFWLKGIYYQDGLLFFDLGARNDSSIPFEVIGPEARILDSKSKKKGSFREQVLSPWLDGSSINPILTKGENLSLLRAYPAFTISNRKRLVFYLREKNGDRELQLTLNGKKLVQANPLPMFNSKPTKTHGSGKL